MDKRYARLFFLVVFGVGLIPFLKADTDSAKPAEPPDESRRETPHPQPIPFSHKIHLAFEIACVDCHPIKEPGFAAGFPDEEFCMTCHESVKAESPDIQKLAEYARSGKPVPWVQVYRVPDYVWFSHQAHHKEAGVDCAVCHGPVAEREVIFKEKSIAMNACMDCHAKYKAPNGCDFCHSTQ